MGLGNSEGLIHDFAGHYFVNKGNLTFGQPTRYLKLVDTEHSHIGEYTFIDQTTSVDRSSDRGGGVSFEQRWDAAVQTATTDFGTEMYSFFTNNCHTFVGTALKNMHYTGHRKWNMVKLASWVRTYGYDDPHLSSFVRPFLHVHSFPPLFVPTCSADDATWAFCPSSFWGLGSLYLELGEDVVTLDDPHDSGSIFLAMEILRCLARPRLLGRSIRYHVRKLLQSALAPQEPARW